MDDKNISYLIKSIVLIYKKPSKINYKRDIKSLGKGNLKRKQRFENNKLITHDKTQSSYNKLKAYYENTFLSRIIKSDYKFAYLLLGVIFIYRKSNDSLFQFLLSKKQQTELLKPFDEALQFFEFTYLSPQKIANSCAICIYQYLKHCTNINDEEKILKIVRDSIIEYFTEHAHVKLRADNFKREIYCAGIYNGMPVFQWHTSTKKESYYSEKDIDKYYRYMKKAFNDIGILKYLIIGLFTKDLKEEDKKKVESKEIIRIILNNLSITYVKNFVKQIEYQEQKNRPKPIKYYLFTPIRLIMTILARFITKLALK